MAKNSRFYFFAAILMIAMMSCSGCSNAQTKYNNGQPKTQSEVEAMLSNYSISLVFDFPEQLQQPYHLTQARNDKAVFFEMKGEYSALMFYDFTANKAYDLDLETKTGKIKDFDSTEAERFKSFHFLIAQYLFGHTMYDELKKTGSEKILGRNATVYTAEVYEGKMKFWIDNEYGFTLKYEQTGSQKMKMEVTKFTVGNVKVEDMINLDNYELEQYIEPEETEPVIIEGVLSLAAMRKAASDAGFTVHGGWSTLTNSTQEPENGFQISVPREGSNFMGIAVLEFATEKLAEEYVAFAATEDAYYSGNIYRSGVFTMNIAGSLVADHEAKLMEALKKAGWK